MSCANDFSWRAAREVPKDGAVLHLGCGNSRLPIQMWAEGYRRQVSVDISDVVVDLMQDNYHDLDGCVWCVRPRPRQARI